MSAEKEGLLRTAEENASRIDNDTRIIIYYNKIIEYTRYCFFDNQPVVASRPEGVVWVFLFSVEDFGTVSGL
ncbi:MAG TPA: hypothetical protein DDW65_18605 [Firmicutes bacterium]|jgi:hypothetical protein|nr:hypothetical protein [Bacillota bacterium]